MIAAVGKGWYEDFKSCTDKFVVFDNTFYPAQKQAEKYKKIYELYGRVYPATKSIYRIN
jgi:xylulokinase